MAFEIQIESISHDLGLYQAPRKKDAGYSTMHFGPMQRKMQVKLE